MIDVGTLAEDARRSGDGEAYRIVVRTPALRIGVGARGRSRPAYFVEVTLDPFPHRPRVEPSRLEAAAAGVRHLAARGYALTCQDDGRVSGERTVGPRALLREVDAVRSLVDPPKGDRRRGTYRD